MWYRVVFMFGDLLHLLTTVSTLLFGGHGLHKQNISVQASKSISRQAKIYSQNKTVTLAKQQKLGTGEKGESNSFSSHGAGKSKKNKDEIAPRSPGNAGSTFHAPSSSPSQEFSRSLPQEERNPISINLQPDLQTNQPAGEKASPQATLSLSMPKGSKEETPSLKQGNELRSTSVNERTISTDTSLKEASVPSDKPNKAAFISQEPHKSNVSASSNLPGQAQIPQPQLPQPTTQQSQQNQTQQPGIEGLVNVPLPSPLILEELQPDVNDVELAKMTPPPSLPQEDINFPPPVEESQGNIQQPPDVSDVELAKITPPPSLPQEDINFPPPVGDTPFDQKLFDEVGKMPPPPAEPIIQPQSDAVTQEESALQKGLKQTKLKPISKSASPVFIEPTEAEKTKQQLKPTPIAAPKQISLTEAQERMNKLRPTQTIKQPETTNPLLSQIRKGTALNKTDTGKLLRQEEEKRQQEMALQKEALAKEGRPVPTVDEFEAKIKEAKEKERLDKEADAKKASAAYVGAMKETEIKKANDTERASLFEEIKKEHKLKPAADRVFSPLTPKNEKESMLEKANKKILARRAAIVGDDSNGDEENAIEAIEEVTPQPTAKTKPKSLPQAQGQSEKSMEEILRERIKNVPVTEQKLLPKGSSDKEEDDEWK